VIHSVARIGVDMPLCSRRAWKTPSGFTTWPTPDCYDDGVVLPRLQSRYPDRKTAGVYHDNHPDAAADAGLRGLLLSRLNGVHWPTFIPALTRAGVGFGIARLPSSSPEAATLREELHRLAKRKRRRIVVNGCAYELRCGAHGSFGEEAFCVELRRGLTQRLQEPRAPALLATEPGGISSPVLLLEP